MVFPLKRWTIKVQRFFNLIEEIVYDGARLNVICSMPKYLDVSPLTILVDDKEVNSGGSLRTLEEEGIYHGLWEIRTEEELPDVFVLTIKIHEIDWTRGEWVFSTPIQKVENNSRTLVAGQKGKVDDVSFS